MSGLRLRAASLIHHVLSKLQILLEKMDSLRPVNNLLNKG